MLNLEPIKTQLAQIDDQIAALKKQQTKLHNDANDLIRDAIHDSKLLANVKWAKFDLAGGAHGHTPILAALSENTEESLNNIRDLVSKSSGKFSMYIGLKPYIAHFTLTCGGPSSRPYYLHGDITHIIIRCTYPRDFYKFCRINEIQYVDLGKVYPY